jgi:hypothetical protein
MWIPKEKLHRLCSYFPSGVSVCFRGEKPLSSFLLIFFPLLLLYFPLLLFISLLLLILLLSDLRFTYYL